MENDILNLNFFDAQIFLGPEKENEAKVPFSSNHKKVIAIYTEERSAKEHLDLLNKILSAVNFDLKEDVQSIPLSTEEKASFIGLQTNPPIDNVLLFGISAKQLGLHFDYELYAPLKCNGCRFLFADELAVISQDKSLKGRLWQSLQAMFLNS
ncbi:MAG: hypothetical protein AAF985_14685 [Bacteroidota bacterium]